MNGVNNLTNPSYDSTLNFGFRINPYIWFTNLDGGVMIESDNGDQFYLDGTPAGNYRINSARMMVIGPGETDAYSNVSFINSYNFPSCVKKITLTLDAGATCDEMYMYPNWWTL